MRTKRARSPASSSSSARHRKSARGADTLSPRENAELRTVALKAKWVAAHLDGTLQPSLDAFNAKATARGRTRVLQVIKAAGSITLSVLVVVACVSCGIEKPLLPSHYVVNSEDEALESCPPGTEAFNNSTSYPCKTCWARKLAERDDTVDGRVRLLMKPYRRLCPPRASGFEQTPVGWFWWRWKEQGGAFDIVNTKHVITKAACCANTGAPILLTGRGMKDAFSPSVNNTDMSIKNPEDHVEPSTLLVCKETNVSQGDAMPVLADSWLCFMTASVRVATLVASEAGRAVLATERACEAERCSANLGNRNNKRANGVTAHSTKETAAYDKQCYELDMSTICRQATHSHKANDKKKGRDVSANITGDQMAERWIAQPWCALSGVLFTINNGPFRPSVDRVTHGVSHTANDTRLVCRILNCNPSWTRRTFVELLLAQTRVEVPPAARAALEAEIAEQ